MVDPIKSLPFETIVQIFSLLSTPELALSTATSRDWRQLIRTDPIINKVIDLTGLSLNEDQTIWLIRHLCEISTDPGKRVGKNLRLNLDPFWEKFIRFSDESIDAFNFVSLMEGTDRKYAELIHAISSSTQGQLGKLFIHVSKDLSLRDRDRILAKLLIFTASELGESNNLLTEVRFIVPFPISVEASRKDEDGETIKLLSIKNACEEDEDIEDFTKRFDSYLCRRLLEQMVDFVGAEGGGLSSLKIDMSRFTSLPLRFHSRSQDDSLLFLEIAKSKETLERLKLRFDSIESLSNLFDLVVSLRSLTLLQFSLDSEEGTIWLDPPAPKQAPAFQLKSLQIWAWEAETEKLDWLVDWVGPDLKEFTLYLSSNPQHSRFSEATLSSILEACSLSLTELILGQLSLSNCSDTPLVRDFPSLASLKLADLSLRGYAIFAGCSMPKLQNFAYALSILGDGSGFLTEEEASIASSHFATILTRCRLTLESLELGDLEASLLEEKEAGTLDLPKVNELEFYESNFIAIEFLSHFKLPLLRCLKIHSSSTQPHSLSELLRSACSHLQEVTLNDSNMDLSMINIFSSIEKVLLPNLRCLEIDQSDAGLIDLFSNAVTGKLKNIKIISAHLCEESDLVQPRLPKSVINLLTTNAPSLVILQLEVLRCSECDLELLFPDLGAGIEFLHLRELRLGLNSPQLLQYFLSDCNLPSLSILWLNTGKLPLYRITNFIKDRSSILTSIEIHAQSFARDLVNWTSETERQVLFPRLATLIIRLCSRAEFFGFCQLLLGLPQALSMTDDVLLQNILEAAPKVRVDFYATQREQREDDGNDQI